MGNRSIKVLFVCLGNICRSPSAEAVMNKFIENRGLEKYIQCDSAGTSGYHAGEKADSRMRRHAERRGVYLTTLSRKIEVEDFDMFDCIVGMDQENIDKLIAMAPSASHADKISSMCSYCVNENPGAVPDPYYGGEDGFEEVLDILEDACAGLLELICDTYDI